MNYIELDLGGKKRGAKLGIGYLRFATNEKKITLDDFFVSFKKMAEDTSPEAIYMIIDLIYLSLIYNCKRKKEDPNFDIDDVFDWIDEDGGFKSKVYNDFINALMTSFGTDVGKNQPEEKEPAKK